MSSVSLAAAVPENLEGMEPGWRTAYEDTLGALAGGGVKVERQDVSWLLDAAKLLYGGTLLAERGNAFGEVLQQMGGDADPSVAAIVLPSLEYRAVDLVADQQRLVNLAPRVREFFERFDALILPTAPGHPTVEAVAADPIGVNSWVGTFTNFVNLLDLSALAVPAAVAGGAALAGCSEQSGNSRRAGGATNAGDSANVEVMLIGPAFGDVVLRQIAAAWVPELRHTGEDPLWGAPRVRLAVFGAHRRGQQLNGQLREAGARFAGMAATAPRYRMGVLDQAGGAISKPAVWRSSEGSALVCELWDLSPAAFARIVCAVPSPLAIGQIELSGGDWTTGFACTPEAREVARELEGVTDWVEYLERER